MDTALVAVTLASLGLAAALLVINWRLTREERRRSAARVAALAAAITSIDDDPIPAADQMPPRAPWVSRQQAASGRQQTEPVSRLQAASSRQQAEPVFDPGSDSAGRDLFGTAQRLSSGSPRLALVVGLGALVVGAAIAAIWLASGDPGDAGAQAAAVETRQAAAPLELVALKHKRDGGALSVSGLVRNPSAGAELKGVTAVVFLFDRSGTFVTSGRAPIDFVALAPGDESPFVVTLQEAGTAGRYRVSFRTDERAIAHVDRRDEVSRVEGGQPSPRPAVTQSKKL